MTTRSSLGALAVTLAVVITACGGSEDTDSPPAEVGGNGGSTREPGTEGGPCYGNGTCNDGLTCLSNLCVSAGKGGASGSAGHGGTSASGGTSGSSGMGGAGDGGAAGDPDAGVSGASGTGGAAGSSGDGGPGTGGASEGGVAGTGVGGNVGDTGPCPTPGDTCPGTELTLTGSGTSPRVGTVDSSTAGLCSESVGSCNAGTIAPDAVYFVVPDIDGVMTVTATAAFETVLYVRGTCDDPNTEFGCNNKPVPAPDEVSLLVYKGKSYYLFVDGSNGSEGAFTLSVSIEPTVCGDGKISAGETCDDSNTNPDDGCSPTCQVEPPPPNDTCPGTSIMLTGTGDAPRVGSVNGGNSSAGDDYKGKCAYNAGKDTVYNFTPDISGHAVIDMGGATATNFDAILYARTTCASDTTELDCDDTDAVGGDNLAFDAVAGTTYYVIVDGDGNGATGTFQLNVKVSPPACGNGYKEGTEACDDGNKTPGDGCSPDCKVEDPPPNDQCSGAIAVPLTGTGTAPRVGSVQGGNPSAIDDYDGSCGSGTGKDVVYTFTPDVTGLAELDLGGATLTPFDAVLYARTDCANTSSQLACNDATGKGAEKISFAVLAGTTYYVFVDGYNTNVGTFTLNIKVTPPSCGNSKVEPPEECDDGSATANCTADCKFVPVGPGDTCPGVDLVLAPGSPYWTATMSGSTASFKSNYSPTCGGSSKVAKDVVYRLPAGTGGKAKVELVTNGTDFDSVLYVRSGDCVSGAQVGCKDTTGDGGEIVEFDMLGNTDYFIFVDGYSSYSGAYELKVSLDPPLCGDGAIDGAEQCDDGNTANNDGCSDACAWESGCGPIPESGATSATNPQVIPAQCKSFMVAAGLPQGDADYFQIEAGAGATITASTFIGSAGTCVSGKDTVLSIWKGPMPAGTNESGGCTSPGFIKCEDNDPDNSPCSKIDQYTLKTNEGGTLILKVHNALSNSSSIDLYGLIVTVQ